MKARNTWIVCSVSRSSPDDDGGLRNDGVESSSDGVGRGGDGSTEMMEDACCEMSGVPPDFSKGDLMMRGEVPPERSEDLVIDGMSSDVVPPDSENDGIDS